jgi:hypothetical protein
MEIFLIPLLIAVVAAFTPRVKYLSQTLTTITHELGHAVAVMPFGGRLQGIKLRLTTEGEAVVSIPRWPFPIYHCVRILNLFAGYSAPIYVSLFFIFSIASGWDTAVKVTLGIMSALVLLFIRNWFGLLVALSFAAFNAAMVILLPNVFPQYALTLAFILLIRGVIDIYKAGEWTFKRALASSDFVIASEELVGPPQLWYVLFCVFHLPVMVFTGITVWGSLNTLLAM